MFTDKELQAYNSIKAPEELYQRLTKIKVPRKNTLRIITALAACLILVITSVFIFGGKSSIIVNGQPLDDSVVFYDTTAAQARCVSSEISVPIEIKADSMTEISVSNGFVLVDGGEPTKEITISSDEKLRWEINVADNDGVFEMRVKDKKGTSKILLNYDNTKITVTKEKVK